jgi:hypothetical protein
MRRQMHKSSIKTNDKTIDRITKSRSTRRNSLENRLDIGGRVRDDAQYFRGRGLLLQRLSMMLSRHR